MVIGGAAFAPNLIPTTLAGYAFWMEGSEAGRGAHRTHFLKHLAMLGGLLFEASTGGKRGE